VTTGSIHHLFYVGVHEILIVESGLCHNSTEGSEHYWHNIILQHYVEHHLLANVIGSAVLNTTCLFAKLSKFIGRRVERKTVEPVTFTDYGHLFWHGKHLRLPLCS
jgi:hypothetical protein